MKRFSYCLLTLAIAMISLIGCSKEADEKKEDTIVIEEKISQEEAVKEEFMPEGTRATKEFIMEEYQLTEEDIEGIDVEAILEL